jgi:hypothetical protein
VIGESSFSRTKKLGLSNRELKAVTRRPRITHRQPSDQSTPRLLLIDDDTSLHELLDEELTHFGYTPSRISAIAICRAA